MSKKTLRSFINNVHKNLKFKTPSPLATSLKSCFWTSTQLPYLLHSTNNKIIKEFFKDIKKTAHIINNVINFSFSLSTLMIIIEDSCLGNVYGKFIHVTCVFCEYTRCEHKLCLFTSYLLLVMNDMFIRCECYYVHYYKNNAEYIFVRCL